MYLLTILGESPKIFFLVFTAAGALQSVEAERLHGLKLEASKWKHALKDVEKRHELAKSKLLADCRAESEKLLRNEEARANREHQLMLQKQINEHKEALELLVSENETKLVTHKNAAEVALKEASRRGLD